MGVNNMPTFTNGLKNKQESDVKGVFQVKASGAPSGGNESLIKETNKNKNKGIDKDG